MKLLMENWRQFINEQNESSRVSTAAVVWNNPNFRPFDKTLLGKISKDLTPEFFESIPQGHSGTILISEDPKRNRIKCVSVDFGKDEGFCSKKHKEDFFYALKNKVGVFVGGRIYMKTFFVSGENIIQNLNSYLPRIIQKWKKISRSDHTPQEFGISYDINVQRALSFVRSKKGCSEYTVIPNLQNSGGDNCGSFALKVVAHGSFSYTHLTLPTIYSV